MSSDDFEIKESGEIVFEKLSDSFAPDLTKFIKPKSSNTTNPENHFGSATIDAFDKAKENIKRQIIESDKSSDNSIIYTAITGFNKRDG